MHSLNRDDIVKAIISASEMNIKQNGENIPFNEDSEYRIDISFYTQSKRDSFIDISYSISSNTSNNISLEKELENNIKVQFKQLGVKKYTIIEKEVDTADGYGRELIKIDDLKKD